MLEIVPAIEIENLHLDLPAIDGGSLYAIAPLMSRLPLIAQSLLDTDGDLLIRGGYAFLVNGVYVFGGTWDFALHREFDYALRKIVTSAVVPISNVDYNYKFMRLGNRVQIHSLRQGRSVDAEWYEFRQEAERALSAMADFKRRMAQEFRALLAGNAVDEQVERALGIGDKYRACGEAHIVHVNYQQDHTR